MFAVVVTFLLGMVALAMVVLLVKDRIEALTWTRRYTPEKFAALEQRGVQRVIHSDWAFYERHLERLVPAALYKLFANFDVASHPGYLEYLDAHGHAHAVSLEPLDERGLLETREWIGHDVVAIARNNFGDPIYLRPGVSQSNTVYITHHDGMDTEELAPSIEDFVRQIRRFNPRSQHHTS